MEASRVEVHTVIVDPAVDLATDRAVDLAADRAVDLAADLVVDLGVGLAVDRTDQYPTSSSHMRECKLDRVDTLQGGVELSQYERCLTDSIIQIVQIRYLLHRNLISWNMILRMYTTGDDRRCEFES